MDRLSVYTMPRTSGTFDTMRISGFQEGELEGLKYQEHTKAIEMLIAMLNKRNDGLGDEWVCGRGLYGVWFDNEFAYVNVGRSCD